jgi:DNA ligase-1
VKTTITLSMDPDRITCSPRAGMSEKFDGIQGRWDGQTLTTRTGRRINAPMDFLAELPAWPVVGELWMGRRTFQDCQSVVLRSEPDSRWRDMCLMVFESTASLRPTKRVRLVKQLPARKVREFAEGIITKGGEGAVIRDGLSFYKIKELEDAEARIVGYEGGQGRFSGLVGALLVERQGVRFKIGTGLSDDLRHAPPPLGAVITYAFEGVTRGGAPRFPRFIRERHDQWTS